MQAIILAAGMGKRLKALTKNHTKCMVEVNGITLIERLLRQLDKKDLNRVVIVTGYKGKELKEFIESLGISTPIEFKENEVYDKTNNIFSLSIAQEELCEDDTLLFESDIIMEDALIDMLIEDENDTVALVDKFESWMDGTCVELNRDNSIKAFISKDIFDFNRVEDYYKTVNIYKFGKKFSQECYVPFLNAYVSARGVNEYYEQVLKVVSYLDADIIKARPLNGEKWYEIDDIQDLDIACSIFAEGGEDTVKKMMQRYGGYWRYPKLLDFCYLVNPYYPPQKLVDELQSNFHTLLVQYPSGMKVNALLAAKNFGVSEEYILVGNGAAELIKSLMGMLKGRVGITRPTFEEYSNRYNKDEVEVFWPQNEAFRYDENDLMEYFDDKQIDNLILINPDNPSGNYIDKQGVMKLIKWTADRNIKLVLDESFVDFAEEESPSFIDDDILAENPHLYVMKSISKSYGVPGLRLGVLASGDTDLIAVMKKDVAIWNINSMAEFYMQIKGKYDSAYTKGLVLYRAERARLIEELSAIDGLTVYPSQANYLMLRLDNGMKASELNAELISNYNIIIKDLVPKIKGEGQYIRIAVRNREDDDRLIEAFKELIQGE